jgi:hypothetical protein
MKVRREANRKDKRVGGNGKGRERGSNERMKVGARDINVM